MALTSNRFVLEVDQTPFATFTKCSGVERESEKADSHQINAASKMPTVEKVPGKVKWSDITLERPLDSSPLLWNWCKAVEDGDIEGARRTGAIVVLDAANREVARWDFERGWPVKWSSTEFNAGSNEIATEKVTITFETLTRVAKR
jgi:phage tail-like protein